MKSPIELHRPWQSTVMTIAHTLKHLGYATIILIASTIPSQAQTTDEPEVDCNNAMTQLEMNICAGRSARESDRQLNLAYQKVLNTYKTEEIAPKYRTLRRETLITAQLAWIKYRDTNCKWQTSKYDGGSIQPLVYASCIDRMSKERTQELLQSIEE